MPTKSTRKSLHIKRIWAIFLDMIFISDLRDEGVYPVMALMTQIRNNLTTAFGVFAGLFIVYIVLDWGMDFAGRRGHGMTGGSEALGEVNGNEISYQYFSEWSSALKKIKKNNPPTDIDEETERQIRSQVWDQLVNEILYDQEIRRLGITVTDQEIRDILQGPTPSGFPHSTIPRFHRNIQTRGLRSGHA